MGRRQKEKADAIKSRVLKKKGTALQLHRPQSQPPGDDQLHDSSGAGEDGEAAGVAEEGADAVFLHVAVAALEGEWTLPKRFGIPAAFPRQKSTVSLFPSSSSAIRKSMIFLFFVPGANNSRRAYKASYLSGSVA
jgi:hypothetical protein